MLTSWTATRSGSELMEALQQRGVPAHVVQNSPELAADPQIAHRHHFVEVPHGKQGTTVVEGTRFILSRTPAQFRYGGPTFGEHAYEVLSETLGYDAERIGELAAMELLE